MYFQTKTIFLSTVCALALSACGGGGGSDSGTTTPPPAADSTPPSVSFNPANLSLQSGMNVEATITATDNVGVTTGPTVTCTNGGSFSGSTFTAPAVTSETTSVCTATAGDAAGNSGSATLTVTITPPPEFSIQGVAAKGLLDGARVIIADAADPLPLELSDFDILAESTTSADGSYTIDVLDSEGALNLLVIAFMNNASMKCDSAIGCGLNPTTGSAVDFGDVFPLGENNALLSAYIPTPGTGTTTANLNSLSTITTSRMIGLAAQAGSATGTGEDAQPILRPQDKQTAQDYIATVLDIPSQDYTDLSFIDLTEVLPATVDQAELRASLLASGFLSSAVALGTDFENNGIDFEFEDLFGEITGSFIVPNALIVRETPQDIFSISLQEMFGGAVLGLDANIQASGGTANNAHDLASDYLVNRLNEINSAPPNAPLESDGNLPQPPAEISFAVDRITVNAGNANFSLVDINNPDDLFPLNSSQSAPTGAISFFADVTSVSPEAPISLNLFGSSPTGLDFSFGGNLTAGTYDTEVTFTVSEFDQTYTDNIIIEVAPLEIGIVQQSASLTTSNDSSFRLDFVNPNNIDISTVFIDNPNGSSFFEVLTIDSTGFDIGYGPSGAASPGTFNVNVILGLGLGAEANDVTVPLEIIVTEP